VVQGFLVFNIWNFVTYEWLPEDPKQKATYWGLSLYTVSVDPVQFQLRGEVVVFWPPNPETDA
jgi:hypothetical protein